MTNGIVLLNLGDRNAAEFSRLEVPGAYDKALGALTAGTYVNVYKWQYQGFSLTASICTVEDKTSYLLLKDKTKGGEMRVYPDDTVEIDSAIPGYHIELLKVILKEPQTPGGSSNRVGFEIYLLNNDGSEVDSEWVYFNVDPAEDSESHSVDGWGSLQWKYSSIFAGRRIFFTPINDVGVLSQVHKEESGTGYQSSGILEAGESYAITETTSTGTQSSTIGIFYKL